MQSSSPTRTSSTICRQMLQTHAKAQSQPCQVFVNHRGPDTKRNLAGLLDQHLGQIGLRSFLDSKSMKPGDNLFDKINTAIRECKVGIAVFSPKYCDSYYCLHELSLMMECQKRVVPIFVDIKPSELHVKDDLCCPTELNKFRLALEQAKNIVGLTFDTSTGDYAEFLTKAMDAVKKNLVEVEEESKKNLVEVEEESLIMEKKNKIIRKMRVEIGIIRGLNILKKTVKKKMKNVMKNVKTRFLERVYTESFKLRQISRQVSSPIGYS